MRIRLLTFDLDDTLWPCERVIQAAEETLADWLQQQAPRLMARHDIASMRGARQALMVREPRIAHDLGLVRRRSLEQLLEESGHSARLADPALALFNAQRNCVEPYGEVIPALQALGRQYQLVSLTNGTAEVAATPLRGLFAHSLNAASVGAARPDPALFLRALQLTGCRASETVHLGDDPLRDIAAARAIGIRAVWVDRHARGWPNDLQPPELRVTNLREFIDWLEAYQEQSREI